MKHVKNLVLTVAALLCLTPSLASATIVYSGRLDLAGPNLTIDINTDGTNDFITGWQTWGGGNGVSANGYDAAMNFGMQYLNTEAGGYPGVKAPLDHGQLIGATAPAGLLWSVNSNDAMLWTTIDFWNTPSMTHGGAWHDLMNRYLGFALIAGPDTYYGWLRLNTNAINEVTLVDYAYENVSGRSIAAGAAPIPEPSTVLLLGAGFAGLAGWRRKRSS